MSPRERLNIASYMEARAATHPNPRAVAFQLVHLQSLSEQLPSRSGGGQSDAEQIVLQAVATLRLSDVDAFAEQLERAETREALDRWIARLMGQLRELSDVVSRDYFVDENVPQQMVNLQ